MAGPSSSRDFNINWAGGCAAPHTSIMDDPDLDPIDETAKPVLSDSELSDVDEGIFAGIDTDRIGLDDPLAESDDDAGPNIFSLKPSKLKTGTGERTKRISDELAEERRRKRLERQERLLEKEEAKRLRRDVDETPRDFPDPNRRPEDPQAARKWDLNRAMDAAIARKPVKRRRKDEDAVGILRSWLIQG
jgi:hypothetical protein